jgi:hypothetical protein
MVILGNQSDDIGSLAFSSERVQVRIVEHVPLQAIPMAGQATPSSKEFLDLLVFIGADSEATEGGRTSHLQVFATLDGDPRDAQLDFKLVDELSAPYLQSGLFEAIQRTADTASHRGASDSRESPQSVALDYGRSLFDAVIVGDVLGLYDQAVERASNNRMAGVRLRLDFDDDDSDVEAGTLPWELLADSRKGSPQFLLQSEFVSVVRNANVSGSPTAPVPTSPIRVLGISASPRDLAPLSIESERKAIESAIAAAGPDRMQLTWVENATVDALRTCLDQQQWHVIHFIGHGGFDEQTQRSYLQFEDDKVYSPELVTLIYSEGLTLFVLNACWTARIGTGQIVRAMADSLASRGVPAVIGMQMPISDPGAADFAGAFYKHICRGEDIDTAVIISRVAMMKSHSLEWAIPALYVSTASSIRLVEKPQPTLESQRPSAPAKRSLPRPVHGRKRAFLLIAAFIVGLIMGNGVFWVAVDRPSPYPVTVSFRADGEGDSGFEGAWLMATSRDDTKSLAAIFYPEHPEYGDNDSISLSFTLAQPISKGRLKLRLEGLDDEDDLQTPLTVELQHGTSAIQAICSGPNSFPRFPTPQLEDIAAVDYYLSAPFDYRELIIEPVVLEVQNKLIIRNIGENASENVNLPYVLFIEAEISVSESEDAEPGTFGSDATCSWQDPAL